MTITDEILNPLGIELFEERVWSTRMTCYSREELEQMLFDVVDQLELSDEYILKHGPSGIPPAELVRLVLDQKDLHIALLKRGMKPLGE